MTLNFERQAAINHARTFLYELTDPKVWPRIPRNLRLRALAILRHYPGEWETSQLFDGLDDYGPPVRHAATETENGKS